MNGLIVVLAAAAAALLFRRRKTLKDDATKVTSTAKEGAAKVSSTAKEKAAQLKDRVRGDADEDDEEAADGEAVLDLDEEAEDTGVEASAASSTD